MKIKILFTGIVGIIAFVASGFQFTDNKQDDSPIAKHTNNYDLKEHKRYVSQTVISCAKCHDCQKDIPINKDSIRIKTYFQNLKPSSKEIQKTGQVLINQEKFDWNNDGNPDNFKTK